MGTHQFPIPWIIECESPENKPYATRRLGCLMLTAALRSEHSTMFSPPNLLSGCYHSTQLTRENSRVHVVKVWEVRCQEDMISPIKRRFSVVRRLYPGTTPLQFADHVTRRHHSGGFWRSSDARLISGRLQGGHDPHHGGLCRPSNMSFTAPD